LFLDKLVVARIFVFLLATTLCCPTYSEPFFNLSQVTVDTAKSAYQKAQDENWDIALQEVKTDKFVHTILFWLYLRSGDADFATYEKYLAGYLNWPNNRKLLVNAELALLKQGKTIDSRKILAWFKTYPPHTLKGRLLAIKHFAKAKQLALLKRQVVETWRSYAINHRDEGKFHLKYRKYLNKADHIARFNMLIQIGDYRGAKRATYHLPRGEDDLYRTILAAKDKSVNFQNALKLVPARLRQHAGLITAQLSWHSAKENNIEAQKLLKQHHTIKGYEKEWLNIRAIQIREAFKTKNYNVAYQLARDHRATKKATKTQFEWLAGWIALRFLNKPEIVLRHFLTFQKNVGTSISKSRGAYWLGRCFTKLKKVTDAKKWYEEASQYGWTFYGQLAAKELGISPPKILITGGKKLNKSKQELVKIAALLYKIGATNERDYFIRQINNQLTKNEKLHLAEIAKQLGSMVESVKLARDVQNHQKGICLLGYPQLADISNLSEVTNNNLDASLVHALILQESRFGQKAISPVGARGYMQIMPYTAKKVAKLLGIGYEEADLIEDPLYNLRLGSKYLANRLEDYEGCYACTLGSYNAGPKAVERWFEQFGNPLKGEVDMLDWIEFIPYNETRNYVERVLENLYVYRSLRGMKIGEIKNIPWWKNWNLYAD
jgi:peptidoglycan lytic transglycosylase